jgi:hypothetical protein
MEHLSSIILFEICKLLPKNDRNNFMITNKLIFRNSRFSDYQLFQLICVDVSFYISDHTRRGPFSENNLTKYFYTTPHHYQLNKFIKDYYYDLTVKDIKLMFIFAEKIKTLFGQDEMTIYQDLLYFLNRMIGDKDKITFLRKLLNESPISLKLYTFFHAYKRLSLSSDHMCEFNINQSDFNKHLIEYYRITHPIMHCTSVYYIYNYLNPDRKKKIFACIEEDDNNSDEYEDDDNLNEYEYDENTTCDDDYDSEEICYANSDGYCEKCYVSCDELDEFLASQNFVEQTN